MKSRTLTRRAHSTDAIHPALTKAVESLESRTLMAIALDANGFTVVTPSNDSKIIYVSSSSGSDANDGSSQSSPVKTLAKGQSLLRDGSPDHLLLKRGDAWSESFSAWTKSGKSKDEPMLISAYGSGDRPHLKVTGSKNGFFSNKSLHDVAILGLHFDASSRNPDSSDYKDQDGGYGIQLVGPTSNFLVEDTSVHHFKYNVSLTGFSGYQKNITIRRSAITDAYDSYKSQGLYASLVDKLTLDGNIFDHNGWNEKLNVPATEFSHNIYLWENVRNALVKNNIIADAASHGIQARGGGVIENNVFVRNPIHALLGNGSTVTPGGVTGRVSGNVFIESRGIGNSTRGWAIELGNIRPGAGAVVSDNIITQDSQNKNPAIKLQQPSGGATNIGQAVGINDVTIERNIVYKWYQGLGIATGLTPGGSGSMAINDLIVRDNDFQSTTSTKIINHSSAYSGAEETWSSNRYYNSASANSWFAIENSTTSFNSWQGKVEANAINAKAKYPDADRTVASYNALLGGSANRDAFLDDAARQTRNGWDARYTAGGLLDYLRAGFTGVTPNGPIVQPPPAVPPTLPPTTPPAPPASNSNPTAALSASDRTIAGAGAHQIKVTYSDDVAVQVNSIGNTDLTVVGPNGYSQPAAFVKVDDNTNGKVRTATYDVAAPGGAWDSADNGSYTVKVNTIGVRDTSANYVQAGAIGAFNANIDVDTQVDVIPPEVPTVPSDRDNIPPTVAWSNFDPASQTIMIRFTKDVSASLNTGDLRLKNTQSGELITYADMSMTYDKATHTATWTIDKAIPTASYKAMLAWREVKDAAGNTLDGNGDGKTGDDHVLYISASEIAAIAAIANGDPLAPVV